MGAQFQHSPGQLVNLLRVAVADEVDMGTRQAAAISFKNLVRKDWEGTGARCRGWRMRTWLRVFGEHNVLAACCLCYTFAYVPSLCRPSSLERTRCVTRARLCLPSHGR